MADTNASKHSFVLRNLGMFSAKVQGFATHAAREMASWMRFSGYCVTSIVIIMYMRLHIYGSKPIYDKIQPIIFELHLRKKNYPSLNLHIAIKNEFVEHSAQPKRFVKFVQMLNIPAMQRIFASAQC